MYIIGIDARAIALFRTKTERVGNCIEWRGEIDKDGYGKFPLRRNGGRKRWMAHRFAYVVAKGPIPDGLEVDHRCRNRACVNPEHLEAVTQKVNHDRWAQAITHCPAGHEYTPENTGRSSRGARRCRACDRAAQMRRYQSNPEKYRAIAKASRDGKKTA